jgi:predicted MPP superfamily phosphohydrolase
MRQLRLCLLSLLLSFVVLGQSQKPPQLHLPLKLNSLRFAVLGDAGTGETRQYELGKQLNSVRTGFPFGFVVMTGDNLYGDEKPNDFVRKFEAPYKLLLASGVKFYASLGNHDEPAIQTKYAPFNMGGERYYTFKPKDGIRFFALDSNYMDKEQLAWLERELRQSGSDWKICFFHHPLYSSGGRHGSNAELRSLLEPLLLKYSVDVVFTGHDHFYERTKPQKGVYYFVVGAGGKLRKGDIRQTNLTAKAFDADNTLLLAEIAEEEMHFQAISRMGSTVDFGIIRRKPVK